MSPGGKCDASRLFFRRPAVVRKENIDGCRHGISIISCGVNLFAA